MVLLEVIHFSQISVEFLTHFESFLDMLAKHCIYFLFYSNHLLMQPVHHRIFKLTQHVTVNDLASQICTAATTKCAALSNTCTRMSPESTNVDKGDWGVFEEQAENAQGQSLKRQKQSKVKGMEMLNIFAYFFQT